MLSINNLQKYSIKTITKPTPVYCIGDSHSIVYDNIYFSEESQLNHTFHCKTFYQPGFCSLQWLDDQGNLSENIKDLFKKANLLNKEGKANHLQTSGYKLDARKIALKAETNPLVIIFCGDIDLRSNFLKKLNNEYDFILPFLSPEKDIQDSKLKILPAQIILNLANKIIYPIFEGLTHLKKLGLNSIHLHSLPPVILNRKKFEIVNGFECSPLIQKKARLLFNYLFKQKCIENNIRFLDTWNNVTHNGNLLPEYLLDDVHLNRKSCIFTFEELADSIANSNYTRQINYNSYQTLNEKASHCFSLKNEHIDKTINASFQKNSIIKQYHAVSKKDTIWLKKKLNFNLDIGNRHFRMDWHGNSIDSFSENLMTALPSDEVVKFLYNFFYFSDICHLIKSCIKSDFTIYNARPIYSKLHTSNASGPQDWHFDNCPPGLVRAILYLSDVDKESGCFEYKDKNEIIQSVEGDSGLFFLFNANKILHRGKPPISKERKALDFVIGPRIPNTDPLLINGGMNNWPVNPWFFSINGFQTYPKLENHFVC